MREKDKLLFATRGLVEWSATVAPGMGGPPSPRGCVAARNPVTAR